MRLFESQTVIGILSVILTAGILLCGLVLPSGVMADMLYIAVIVLSLWSPWRNYIYPVAAITSVLTIAGYFLTETAPPPWATLVNWGFIISGIWITAFLVNRIVKHDINERIIVETVGDGIVTIDERGTIRSFNPGAERMFGYTSIEALGKNISMLMPPPYREEHDQYLNNYLTTGNRKIIGSGREVKGLHKNGEVFPAFLTVNESYKNKKRHFVGVIHDITARKEAEDELRRQYEFNERLIDTARVIILQLDTDARIVKFNRYMEELSGYKLDEVKGKDWFSTFIPSEDRVRIREVFNNSMARVQTNGNINTILTKDGRPRVIEWYDSQLTDPKGNVTELLATGYDITERKTTHDKLVSRTQQLVVLSTLEQMVLTGSQLLPLFHNAVQSTVNTLQMDYGYMLELLPDNKQCKLHTEISWLNNLTETTIIPLESDVLAALALSNQDVVTVKDIRTDPRFIESSRRNRHEVASGMGARIGNPEQPLGALCVYKKRQHQFTDDEINFLQSIANILAVAIERYQGETRVWRLQQELMHTSRASAVGELGTTITHEVNQPITALMNYTQSCQRLLRKKYKQLPENIAGLMDKIIGEAERVASFIHHLRDYIQFGTLYQQNEDLNQLVRETCELVHDESTEKNIKMTCDFHPELKPAYVDKIQIQQVLFNLLRNSMDALEQVVSREIQIKTGHCDNNMLEVMVEDTGPGVRPDILELEFKETYSNKEHGLGIGLSICKNIIEAHGGKLWCSPYSDSGAIFHFTVPASA